MGHLGVVLASCAVVACTYSPPDRGDSPTDTPAIDSPDRIDAPAAIDAAPIDAPDCSLDQSYTVAAGSKFHQLPIAPTDWLTAELACESEGAHLMVFANNGERAALDPIATNHAWMGVTDRITEATYRAVNGQANPFMDPITPMAALDCLRLNEGDAIEERSCAEANLAVCECDGRAVVAGSY